MMIFHQNFDKNHTFPSFFQENVDFSNKNDDFHSIFHQKCVFFEIILEKIIVFVIFFTKMMIFLTKMMIFHQNFDKNHTFPSFFQENVDFSNKNDDFQSILQDFH